MDENEKITEEIEAAEAEEIETEDAITENENEILPGEDGEPAAAEQDLSASDLSYLFEPEEESGEWLDAVIEEASAEGGLPEGISAAGEAGGYEADGDAADAGEAGEAVSEYSADAEGGEGAGDEDAAGEGAEEAEAGGDAADDADAGDAGADDAGADGAAEDGADAVGGGAAGENAEDFSEEGDEDDEWREATVSTQNFYEMYGAEIQAYLSGHTDEDPIEEYEEIEEEQAEEEGLIPKKKKKRKKKHYLIRFLVIVGVIVAAVAFMMSSYFDIKQVDVEGTKTLKKSQIVKMSGIETGTNIFKLHKKDVEQRLLESSYIAHVEIKRDYPGTVRITVLERRESAAVKYGTEYLIIDPDGYVLRKVKKLPKRTLLSDMKIREIEIGKKLEVTDEEKFEQALALIRAMRESNMYFKKIEFGKTKVKAFIYDKLVCVGTYDDLLKNIENGNLSQVARDLYSKKIKKGTVRIDGGKYISYDPN